MAKINFSGAIQPIVSGQKANVMNGEARLIANSTSGKFQLTPAATKALGISRGEHVKFFDNRSSIEEAINNKTEWAIAAADQLGVDIDTPAGKIAIVEAALTFYVCKGWQRFESNGRPAMSNVRLTKEDKLTIIAESGAELITNAEFRKKLIERVGNPDASDEELINAINVDDIKTETEAYEGSKTASTGTATGVGLLLSFTDTAIWTAMKQDLEDKTSKNRSFKVCLDAPVPTTVNNGFKEIEVVAYPLEFVEDTDPMVRGDKDADAE